MAEGRPLTRPALVLVAALLTACGGAATPPAAGPSTTPPAPLLTNDESELLDTAFPLDIERIEATFDVFPTEHRIAASAVVTFRMRPGQARPRVHLLAARGSGQLRLLLDGELLDPLRSSDVREIQLAGSTQLVLELQRDLVIGPLHRLEASYPLFLSDGFGRFYSDVNDIVGRGNEPVLPTLNTPRELARHLLTFRVHAAEPYQMLGSGLVSARTAGDVQEWTLDTEREVASYTVMFFLAPARDLVVAERTLHGVDVRVLSYTSGPSPDEAFVLLDPWLLELQTRLGPFPMPRGLSVVLTASRGGMEYFGGTITSLAALRHETFHMYYGCSTVARTYRDSWWDEAINQWYELSNDPTWQPIPEDYSSGIVGTRSPIGVGFDQRAYDQGARMFQAVALSLGGRDAMVGFLRELHLARSFSPFTTWDLADELQARRGVDVHARFQRWLYQETAGSDVGAPAPLAWLHQVDLTPPEGVRPR